MEKLQALRFRPSRQPGKPLKAKSPKPKVNTGCSSRVTGNRKPATGYSNPQKSLDDLDFWPVCPDFRYDFAGFRKL
jgi:hypothetical protein